MAEKFSADFEFIRRKFTAHTHQILKFLHSVGWCFCVQNTHSPITKHSNSNNNNNIT